MTGGYDPDRGALDSADLSDPGDSAWERTGSMHEARLGHSATTLMNGLVLVAGGQAGPSKESLSSTELYDSSMQGWRQANPMATARDGHTATLLDDGELLVAGGFVAGGTTASAEVYGPDPRQLPAEGRADNGRYATTFDPPLSFTLTLRASVGVNAPAFIGLAFGFDPLVAHGGGAWAAEIQFNRPDQVFDVNRPDVLVDTPPDLGAWIAKSGRDCRLRACEDHYWRPRRDADRYRRGRRRRYVQSDPGVSRHPVGDGTRAAPTTVHRHGRREASPDPNQPLHARQRQRPEQGNRRGQP
ncbi:MAG: hypothetical protein H0W81_10875 [Chloroflexi bacterium]|nr:hypothetical protein [Chloroflexota bacterium]